VAVKLARKGCEAALADQVAEALAAQGLLSDDRFAESLVHSWRNRGYGPVRIRHALREKGVAPEAADRWADIQNNEWVAELERVRRKKFGARLPRSYAERARQIKFLQYRGFTFDQIQRVLKSDAAD
jgi:regulatory protein